MGFALRLKDGSIISGVKKFKHNSYEGAGMRYLRFSEQIRNWHKEYELKFVAFEEVRAHTGTIAAHVYGGFKAVLTKWCEENSVPYCGVPVGVIKKSATGKGSASKEQMIAAANELGFYISDDNEADAIHILMYATGRWLDTIEYV